MHCKSCETLIRDVSADFPEVTGLKFDFGKKEVAVDSADGFDVNKWATAVSALGPDYEVKMT
ncbi:hypothetical protein A3A67_01420 [Candidatus Peribacteria bacterium RIFCSPLOWO2_01_FULL_51_18]|nr:MAG: hypothetical protein A3A67_01420 [Candidatus Peribacteria bacterium RIFCSPLOWO2_01_FULL_51_18]OGJ69590.1 MAG: hypothetical protein A3J34_00090 [Candidatus Peribacteria bacterium RIFCSPLOWO2_02_FULL_51_10]